MSARVERPDFERITRRVTSSGPSWRSQDWQQTQADTLALIAYALQLEQDAAAAREALETAAYNHHLGMGCKSPTGQAKDCSNPVCQQNFSALAILAAAS